MNVSKIDNSVDYKLRVPKNLVKSYYVMKLNSPRPIQFGEITDAYVSRKGPSAGEEDTSATPSSGAGSEYGKEWKEEMKRKRRGQSIKKVSKEDMLYSLKLCGKKEKRFEGKKEGTILENSSYYILTQCPDGVFEAVPLQAWYNFNPTIEYHTLSLDEVEKEFSKRDKTLNYHNMMLKKRLQATEEKEEEIKAKVKSTYDDLVIHDDDEESDAIESGNSSADEHQDNKPKTTKKGKQKDTYISKKKKEAANEDDEDEDSDEEEEFDNVESKECDYMSESSSNDEAMLLEDEPEPDTNRKTKAKDDLNAFVLSDSEEEEDLTAAGKELKEILKRDEGEDDSSEDEDVDIDADEKYSKSALFMQGNGNRKKKSGRSGSVSESSSSSRSATPTPQLESNQVIQHSGKKSKEDSLTYRKRGGSKETSDASAKKIRKMEGSTLDQTGNPKGAKDSKDHSRKAKQEASSSSSGKEPLAITEATIRRYLSHKPMTTTDLVKKFKTKKTGLTREQTVSTIAAIVKRIGPEKQHIDGKLYLSIKSSSKK